LLWIPLRNVRSVDIHEFRLDDSRSENAFFGKIRTENYNGLATVISFSLDIEITRLMCRVDTDRWFLGLDTIRCCQLKCTRETFKRSSIKSTGLFFDVNQHECPQFWASTNSEFFGMHTCKKKVGKSRSWATFMHDFQPARFRNLTEKGLFVYTFAWFDKSWYNALLPMPHILFIIPTDTANSSLSKCVQTNNSVFQAKF